MTIIKGIGLFLKLIAKLAVKVVFWFFKGLFSPMGLLIRALILGVAVGGFLLLF